MNNQNIIQTNQQSLEIVQGQNRISLSYRISAESEGIDILNYSADEPSLTFNIQQQNQNIKKYQNDNINEPQKKKRRQIFAKYKKNNDILPEIKEKQQKNFMQQFDEIFHLNQRKAQQKRYRQQMQNQNSRRFSKKISVYLHQEKYGNQQNQIQNNSKNILPVQFSNQKCRQNNMSISDIGFRFSEIQITQTHTDESQQFQSILQSQIFKQNAQIDQSKEIPFSQLGNSNNGQDKSSIKCKNQLYIEQKNDQIAEKILISPIKEKSSTINSTQKFCGDYKLLNVSQSLSQTKIASENDRNNQKKLIESPVIQKGLQPRIVQNLIPQKIKSIEQKKSIQNISGSRPKSSNNNQKQISIALLRNVEVHTHTKSQQLKQNINIERNLLNKSVSYDQAQQEQRFPIFLRKARKFNTSYLNLYNPQNVQFYERQNQKVNQLVTEFNNVLQFIESISDQINIQSKKIRDCIKQFEYGFKVQYFLNSGWEKVAVIDKILQIQPHMPFTQRPFDYENVKKAIESYQKLIHYYINMKFSLETDQGKQKYLSFRQKFWQVERNIRMISQDLYIQILKIQFPIYYHECLQFLRKPFPKINTKQIISQRKYLLGKFSHLKNQKDPLSCSQVGRIFKDKLQRQLKFLCPF